MSGHLLGVAAVAALAAAGLVRKGSLSERAPVTNEDLAAALRAYRPPAGSASKRGGVVEVSPQDFPGQSRLPGFTDDELVKLGLARKKDEASSTKKRRSRKKPVDLDAEAERSAEEAMGEELSALASLELQRQAAEALREQSRRVRSQGAAPLPQRDPRGDGPWELFLRSNPSDVSDQVLVALLLADGTGDPMERARVLLDQAMGSLGQLVEGSFGEEAGVPEATRARLIAAAELSRRAELRQMFTTTHKVRVDGPERAVEFLRRMSRGPQEIVSAIYIGGDRQVIGYRVLHKGAPRLSLVDAGEVFRPAVVLRAASVIIAHQHPAGNSDPSTQDIELTRRLVQVGQVLQIPLEDHIVLGNDSHTSFRQNALVNFTPNRLF